MTAGSSTPIVLITGPPGAGKSTVGRLVVAPFERSVHIEADVVRESIVGGFIPPSPEMFGEERIEQVALEREQSAASVVAHLRDDQRSRG